MAGQITEAIRWYVVHILHQELEKLGGNQAALSKATHIGVGKLNQVLRHARAAGVETMAEVAAYRGQDPGEFLNEAIAWYTADGALWARNWQIQKLATG